VKKYFIYIITNKYRGTLYIRVTNSISKRIIEHTQNKEGFCFRYNLFKLVYLEEFSEIEDAIKREKQLKNWHRDWKINLIENNNKNWIDFNNRGP